MIFAINATLLKQMLAQNTAIRSFHFSDLPLEVLNQVGDALFFKKGIEEIFLSLSDLRQIAERPTLSGLATSKTLKVLYLDNCLTTDLRGSKKERQ